MAHAALVELLPLDRDEAVDEVLDAARLGLLEDHHDVGAGRLDQVLLQRHHELFHLESVLVGHTLEGVDDEERLLRQRALDPVVDVLDLGHRAPLEERLEVRSVDARRWSPFLAEASEDLPAGADLALLRLGHLGLGRLAARPDRVEEQLRGVEDPRAHLGRPEPRELAVERLVAHARRQVVRARRLPDPFEQLEPERRLSRSRTALDDERSPALPAEEEDDLGRHSADRASLACAHVRPVAHGRTEGPRAQRTIPCPVPSWAPTESKGFASWGGPPGRPGRRANQGPASALGHGRPARGARIGTVRPLRSPRRLSGPGRSRARPARTG